MTAALSSLVNRKGSSKFGYFRIGLELNAFSGSLSVLDATFKVLHTNSNKNWCIFKYVYRVVRRFQKRLECLYGNNQLVLESKLIL